MTVLVDTGVLYADHDTDAARHDVASEALDAVYDGEFGQPYVSDYVYDEAVTLTLKRAGAFGPAKRLGEKLRGVSQYPDVYEHLHVTRPLFDAAIQVFEQYDDQSLSFTDASIIACCERADVDAVLSFDDDFDGLVDRIPPATVGN